MGQDDLLKAATSMRTKLIYGFGSVAFGVKNNGFKTILLMFYNQVVNLPAHLVGLVLLAAMLLDALLDPIIGQVSDNLRSRWGRRHPLMYLSAVPLAVSYLLLWNPPMAWSQGALLMYLFTVAVVVRSFISLYEIPSSALLPELTPDYDQRTAMSAYRMCFGWYGGMVMNMLAFQVFFAPTAGYAIGQLNPEGYAKYGLVAAAVLLVSILVSAIGTHRLIPILRKPEARVAPLGEYLGEMWSTLANRAFLILTISQLFAQTANGLVFSINIYMQTFFWELSNSEIALLGIGTIIAVTLSFFVGPWVSKRLGKREGSIVLFAAGLAVSLVPFTLRMLGWFPENGSPLVVPILFAFNIMSNTMTIGSSILGVAMFNDVVEDHEVRTGRRAEGLFFAGNSVALKAISGVGVFASGLLLELARFPQHAVPGKVDPEIVRNLGVIYSVSLVVLFGISLIVIKAFPITRARHEKNLHDLAARADAASAKGAKA